MKKMNRREKKLVKHGCHVQATRAFHKRTGRSLKEAMDEIRRVKAKLGPQH